MFYKRRAYTLTPSNDSLAGTMKVRHVQAFADRKTVLRLIQKYLGAIRRGPIRALCWRSRSLRKRVSVFLDIE